MTTEQETEYVHQLLNLMKEHTNGYVLQEEGTTALGYSRQEVPVLMRRLAEEGLATKEAATLMTLTSHGYTVARGPGGYHGYLAEQKRQQTRKSNQEYWGFIGTLVGGIAGALGAFIAGFALYDAHQTSGELDSMRHQMQQLTQQQAATRERLATLAAQQAAQQAQVHQNQASTPKVPATKSSPAPTPPRNHYGKPGRYRLRLGA